MSTRVAWDSTKRNHGQIHADFSAIARAVQSRGHPKPGSSGDGEITVCSSAEVTAPWAARAAVRTSFGLDSGLAMTGAEAFEAVMERGKALALANGWRLARRRLTHHRQGWRRADKNRPIPRPAATCLTCA